MYNVSTHVPVFLEVKKYRTSIFQYVVLNSLSFLYPYLHLWYLQLSEAEKLPAW